ncbi:hypothetical protein ACOMHN_036951 [Nucella lapillus]
MFPTLKWHKMSQPNSQLPYVLDTCTLPSAGMLFFLVYNFLLLFISSVLTFCTLHLENWERNLIFACTTSSLIIWPSTYAFSLVPCP